MNKEHQKIIDLITAYLEKNPTQRFGQALFNLNINLFLDEENPSQKDYNVRDIHVDKDNEIIERIENRLKKIDLFEAQNNQIK